MSRTRRPRNLPVVIRGMHFVNATEAAKYFKVTAHNVNFHARNGTLDKVGLSTRRKRGKNKPTTAPVAAVPAPRKRFLAQLRDVLNSLFRQVA